MEPLKSLLILVFGLPGAGKTAFLTYRGIEAMRQGNARRSLKACRETVNKLNAGGFRLTVPKDHLVFSDYRIAKRKTVSHLLDISNLGLPGPHNPKAQFLPPFSTWIIDEAQRKLNSRAGGIDDNLSLLFEIRRHNDISIFMACQRTMLIDKNARELVDKVIEIQRMTHKYDRYGRLIRTTWHCVEFDSALQVERYLDSGKAAKYGKATKYNYDGNIFKCYDHQHRRPAFYADCYDRDFDIIAPPAPGLTVASMRAYNATHTISKETKQP